MPELPEVETVRRGLEAAVRGHRIESVEVLHHRAVRRQPGGAAEFVRQLLGRTMGPVRRRGKFLWVELDDGTALAAHLGMSGQFRLGAGVDDGHCRVVFTLEDGGVLLFRDQRTFGWVAAQDLGPDGLPGSVTLIGRDPLDPVFDLEDAASRLARSRSGIKRGLLAQRAVSGVGNIYADEALWRARVHPETPGTVLGVSGCGEVVRRAGEVMQQALGAGGTSFDPLFVSVNGEAGWFARDLDVYGRAGEPCARCGAPIVRERFGGRSAHRCPVCQPEPHPNGTATRRKVSH